MHQGQRERHLGGGRDGRVDPLRDPGQHLLRDLREGQHLLALRRQFRHRHISQRRGGGGTTITGGVHSNSSINVGGGGSHFGPTTYGNGSGCLVSPSSYQQNSNSFTAGPTAIAPITWPIDYSTNFPDCGGTGQLGCTGPGGTPSFCTQATTATSETLHTYNPSNLSTGNIYCDVGTGTASLPSHLERHDQCRQEASPIVTFVAGSVTIRGGSSFGRVWLLLLGLYGIELQRAGSQAHHHQLSVGLRRERRHRRLGRRHRLPR